MTAAVQQDPRRLYESYKHEVFALCLRYAGGDRGWAEDVTHDVFVKVIRHIDELSAEGNIGGWIYRVATNTCLSRLHRDRSIWRRVRARLMRDTREAASPPDEQAAAREGQAAVYVALARLEPLERVVFAMKYLDDRDQAEICQTLGLSKGYVSKLVARARAKVAELVGD